MKRIETQILKILHEKGRMKLGDIASELGKEKNITHYYLKKLTAPDRKTLETEGGYYWISDRKKIEDAIVDLLLEGERTYSELSELYQSLLERDLSEDAVWDTLFIMERDGHVRMKSAEEHPDIEEDTYSLPAFEYSKRDICVVCKTKIEPGEQITALVRLPERGHTWRAANIHKECFHEPEANFLILNGKYDGNVFCDHCGLPLSPKMIAVPMVSHHLLYEHFTEMETRALKWVEYFFYNFPETTKEELEEFYKEITEEEYSGPHDFAPIPYQSEEDYEFIKALLGKFDDLGDFWKIRPKLMNMVGTDLSRLSWTERLMKDLLFFFTEVPDDYDVNSRIQDIWKAAQEYSKGFEADIQRLYEKLLGPIGSVYSRLQPSWVIYDDKKTGDNFNRRGGADLPNKEWDHGEELYSQVITFREKGTDKVYHPYCAEKLGITTKEGGG